VPSVTFQGRYWFKPNFNAKYQSMAFFIKKNTPVESANYTLVDDSSVTIPSVSPSVEGQAIAQKLSGHRVLVPAGFKIKATRLTVTDGIGLIFGQYVGHLEGLAKAEIAAGGSLEGRFSGYELSVKGSFAGEANSLSLTVKAGGSFSGRASGKNLLLEDGSAFNGEFKRLE
jgi:Polymer-forming cytoskeletal